MDSLFFWIIVLSFLVPVALRLYRKSAGRNQDKGMMGGYPGQLPGGYPGQNKQPRDGYTQQDYFTGGFGPAGGGRPAPADQPYPGSPYPGQAYPGQPFPDSPYPGQQPGQPYPGQQAGQPSESAVPPPVPPARSGPQGYRARKLAELDQRYSDGELNLEDYLAQRAEIMEG